MFKIGAGIFLIFTECRVKFNQVTGKCFVSYDKNLKTSLDTWSAGGPYRFYFSQAYDQKSKRFFKPSKPATDIGNFVSYDDDVNTPVDWPKIKRPLRTMDVFAGCGGGNLDIFYTYFTSKNLTYRYHSQDFPKDYINQVWLNVVGLSKNSRSQREPSNLIIKIPKFT